MANNFYEQFPNGLIELKKDNAITTITMSQLHGKSVAVYFVDDQCVECESLMEKLDKAVAGTDNETKEKITFICIPKDEKDDAFDQYYKKISFEAFCVKDRECSQKLKEQYNVTTAPFLMIFSGAGEMVTRDGVEELNKASDEAIQQWVKGNSLFGGQQPIGDESRTIVCHGCSVNRQIQSGDPCANEQCDTLQCYDCPSGV